MIFISLKPSVQCRSTCSGWHLKRDMAVLLDGTVPLCKEDLRAGTRLGNALHEDLEVIWDRAQAMYRSHMSGSYPGICAACDEYYTFNF